MVPEKVQTATFGSQKGMFYVLSFSADLDGGHLLCNDVFPSHILLATCKFLPP
jgi:hypothetical protein